MGLFNWISDELYCPYCGHKQDGWQTKEHGELYLNTFSLESIRHELQVKADRVERWLYVEVHTICKGCGQWLSVTMEVTPDPEIIKAHLKRIEHDEAQPALKEEADVLHLL